MKPGREGPHKDVREGAFPSVKALSRRKFLTAAGAGGAILLLPGLPQLAAAARPAWAGRPGESVVLLWNDAFLQGVRDAKLGPPMVARAVQDIPPGDGAMQLGAEPDGAPGVPYSGYTGYAPVNYPLDIRTPFDPASVHVVDAWQPLRYVDGGGNVVTPKFVGAHWQR